MSIASGLRVLLVEIVEAAILSVIRMGFEASNCPAVVVVNSKAHAG